MAYADDIRTIARTKEILDKANKALKTAEVAKKEAIDVQRSYAYQQGDGSKTSGVGNNGSGESTTGTGPDGLPVIGPLAPPPNPPRQSNNTTENEPTYYSDPWGKQGTGYSLDPNGSNNNNKTDSADEQNPNESNSSGGSTSREDKKNQADPDSADPSSQKSQDWENIKASEQYTNASDEEKRRMEREFWATEEGSVDIGEAYEGTDGPKPSEPSYTEQVGTNYPQPRAETIKEFVGVDPDNESVAIALRLDGKLNYPSDAEAAAGGQEPWTGPEGPPIDPTWIGYEQGKYWTGSGTYFLTATEPAPGLLPLNSIGYTDIAFGYVVTDVRNIEVEPGGGSYEVYNDWSGTANPENSGWSSGNWFHSESSCGVEVGTDRCPTAPPSASAFPIVGIYGLRYINGQIDYSPYDSEVPAKYRSPSSVVAIKSKVTGDTYSISPSINGGTMVINETNNQGYFLYYSSDNTLKYPVPMNQLKFYTPRSK